MKVFKVVCPVCGGEVKKGSLDDYEIYSYETIEHYTGTCKDCGEIVEYNVTYQHINPKIEIIDHYEF